MYFEVSELFIQVLEFSDIKSKFSEITIKQVEGETLETTSENF